MSYKVFFPRAGIIEVVSVLKRNGMTREHMLKVVESLNNTFIVVDENVIYDKALELLDDRDARSLAKKLGLQVIGTLGVIALAKYNGLIPEAKTIVDELIEKGFWVSRRILEEFHKELGKL